VVGDVIFITIIMWIVAFFAFAPLAYFIYVYTAKGVTSENAKPFGDTEPHGDSESKTLDLVEQLVHKVKGLISKK
jgi:hypothetical protein